MMPKRAALLGLIGLCALAAPSLALGASETPAWSITATQLPANLAPSGRGEVLVLATNVGAKEIPASSSYAVEVALPVGLAPLDGATEGEKTTGKNSDPRSKKPTCTANVAARTVRCETSEPLGPGRYLLINARLEAEAIAAGTLEVEASVSGGGAEGSSTTLPVAIQAGPVPFGFLPGFAAPANNPDGSPSVAAGSHPAQQSIQFGFPTKQPAEGGNLTNDGHPRNFSFELPRGLIGNPAATPALCTEAQLSSESCPPESQVGVVDVVSLLGQVGFNSVFTSALFNMVPPPGKVASFATSVANAGIFVHALASVRSGTDYHASAEVRDALAFGTQPIFSAQNQLWGDPTSAAHDLIRGGCLLETQPEPCAAKALGEIPFLTTPGDCPGEPLRFEALTDSWEKPSPPAAKQSAAYESADLQGSPVWMEGCSELEFKPSIEARPSTDKADSPAGLDFSLRQPQEGPRAEPLEGRATAILKDATVTFPAGLAVNPSQAAGLGACTEAQIGYTESQGGVPRFSEAPQSCPNASKIGTVEARSPLLAQYDEEHEVVIDPETGAPEARALHGSLYLAAPFANPYGSLIAVYLAVEEPETGLIAKLSGEGRLDPATGQISTSFTESPEVPIEDIHVHVFGGDRGAFTTPQDCATYTTTADLTPWSYRPPAGNDPGEGAVAHPTGSFEISQAPGGGPCPAAQPNAPAMRVGTLEPVAAKYSPLAFKLTREDGSERLAGLKLTLPPGLTARLAGVAQCSDAQIAQAKAREAPERGKEELADPSCPASSQLGTVTVAAGSGPSPYHTTGAAYLAGPYKGAPLSMAIITPAVAGPFDLGTVVVRAATYIDPVTARPMTVSDPLPQIIDGVPVDVRSVSLSLDRPKFVLNPTSCDESHFEGEATSALGHIAPLAERFQVGGCKSLPYKPRLSARLFGKTHRGAHPRLRAIFQAKPGEANTARISFALPHSEFIDQAHFRTICTRVQFAARQCPKGSVYGHMKAITPLLDTPLEGPIYLRSSTHELPDVVAALHGPPSLPVEVELAGRVDSVHGGVRTIFEAVPDAPVAKAIVTMQGNKKGLFQNSTQLCRSEHRITLRLNGQNGKTHDTRPLLKVKCAKGKKHGKRRGRHRLSR
jgi:hypothetical protein